MKRLSLVAILSMFVAVPHSYGQECKAISSDRKQLTGAAKTSFLRKCCEAAAKSKDGKPLAGAARNSYVEKCMKG